MEANETNLLRFLDNRQQFIAANFSTPVQLGKEKQCKQLWDDVLRVGENEDIPSHFLGSIVYIEPVSYSVPKSISIVIDGQQRLTTLSLLLFALGRAIEVQGR